MFSGANKELHELDDRMTHETKVFVRQQLKKIRPSALMSMDIKAVRRTQAIYDEEQNINTKFFNSTENDFLVPSIVDDYEIEATVFVSKAYTPDRPIIIFSHGGGLAFFSRKTYRCSIAHLVEKVNCICITFDYRQTPEHKHPIQLDDLKSVITWVNRSKLSLFGCHEDTPLGVAGDSAGGNLSASICHELKDKIDFQILIYPVVNSALEYKSLDEFNDDQYLLPKELLNWFVEQAVSNESFVKNPKASPILYEDFSGLPKCLIICAELDPLIDDSRFYAKRLDEARIENELVIINGAVHGCFVHFKECRNAFNQCIDAISSFISNKVCQPK